MYPLDLETMLAVMREQQLTGMLSATLPRGTGGMRLTGHVEIVLKSGTVVTCRILTASGQSILENQEALRVLARAGRLDWSVTFPQESPLSLSPVSQIVPARKAVLAPRRLQYQVRPEQMATWSRLQRQVFALVDGKRTVEQIAAILSTSVVRVQKELLELQEMQMILIETGNET